MCYEIVVAFRIAEIRDLTELSELCDKGHWPVNELSSRLLRCVRIFCSKVNYRMKLKTLARSSSKTLKLTFFDLPSPVRWLDRRVCNVNEWNWCRRITKLCSKIFAIVSMERVFCVWEAAKTLQNFIKTPWSDNSYSGKFIQDSNHETVLNEVLQRFIIFCSKENYQTNLKTLARPSSKALKLTFFYVPSPVRWLDRRARNVNEWSWCRRITNKNDKMNIYE